MSYKHLIAAALMAVAGMSSSQATTTSLTQASGWQLFDVVDPSLGLGNTDLSWIDIDNGSTKSFSFTIAAGQIGVLTVVDAAFSGDVFSVKVNGLGLDNTSAAVNGYPTSVGDFDAALADSNFSRGVYSFAAGSYMVTGALYISALDDAGAPLNSTVGALKLEVAAVPESSTLAMLLAGLCSVGLMVRRRTC